MTTAFRDGTRFALRTATAACHARVDERFGRLDLSRPEGLGIFLAANHVALGVIEPALRRAEGLPSLPSRLSAIEADLGALGRDVPAGMDGTLDGHDLLGVAYVVGGSALGGRLLARRRAASSDPAVRRAGRFMDDPRMMPYWASIQGSLRSVGPGDARFARLLAAADATFGIYEAALREVEGDAHE